MGGPRDADAAANPDLTTRRRLISLDTFDHTVPTFTRRRALLASATLGASSLAGCLGGCGDGGLFGPDMPHDGEIATDPPTTPPEGATLVDFSALPPVEQSLARTAVEEGIVRVCLSDDTDRAAALESFSNRVTIESSYLAYDGAHYPLWVRTTDTVNAGTASAETGGDDENPCC